MLEGLFVILWEGQESHAAHRRVKSQHQMLLLICWLGPSFLSSSATPFPASSLTTLCILCIFILTAPGRGDCSPWATQISCICYSVEECSKTVAPAYVWYWLFGLPAGWHWRTISNFPMFPNSSVTSMKLLDKRMCLPGIMMLHNCNPSYFWGQGMGNHRLKVRL